jgi:hypothetical protein
MPAGGGAPARPAGDGAHAGGRVASSVSSDEEAYAVSSGATPRTSLALQLQLVDVVL